MTQQILSHCFSNGLVLLAEPMNWLESAAFTFLVPAGCAHDPADRVGLSSFLCEMALRGCGDRDNRQFVEELDNLGVERSESVADSHTRYSGATLASHLEPALALYADLLQRPRLPEEHLESARQSMLQELRAVEDEPAQKLMNELRRRHYPSPWGRPNQGELAAIEAIDIGDLRAQYGRTYHPQGAILGVAGRVDWNRLRDTVGQLLGDWSGANGQPIVEDQAEVAGRHIPYESNQTQIGIAYASVPYRHPDYLLASSGVGVLSGSMSSRLFTEVREKRGLCYSVYAAYHTLLDRAAVLCYGGTTADRAQETLDVILAELGKLPAGIYPEELARLKTRTKNALIMQQESSYARSGAIARDWYHLGRARTLAEINELIEGLTCERINAYLAEHPPADFTVVTLGPSQLEIPGEVR